MEKIKSVKALKILDSRGDWTIEVEILLNNGLGAKASVPSGKSIGRFEAKTVPADTAVSMVESEIAEKLINEDFVTQEEFDRWLIAFDGSGDKSRIGANSTLALSVAFCKVSAKSLGIPLYDYLDSLFQPGIKNWSMPIPIFNIINGGKHTSAGLDFQEFIAIPALNNINRNIDFGKEIYQSLYSLLLSHNFSTDVGDEGGFAPKGLSSFAALNFIIEAGKMAGYIPGKDFFLGIDCAASQLAIGDLYELKNENLNLTASKLKDYYLRLTSEFPIVYLEDPYSEDAFDDWKILTKVLQGKIDVVGDDLIATNVIRVDKAVVSGAVNAVIIKPNQAGTVTETIETIKNCRKNKLGVVASHRSGDTNDEFIADFAVGIGAKYLKAGSPARGERVAKYDRLLEIEKGLMAGN